ncbi:hypothetical protein ASD00_32090 [Ensifer sp. Root31]|uniref:fumarylacetoacetate hydrolase family protein n=1 Tax=Ensifer sp. Root31 TaxID=1736512 RepID=UPI0007109AC3|nr:fumarylacetoacetate hydrolase family protein [Ensifer sp. Root31]KQU85633.1 hypothetical protein ASD00_32090 [Ensifer sp. Root31]
MTIEFAYKPKVIPIEGEEISFAVRRIYCVGRNYLDHIREMKEGDERDPPFFFQKPADAIVPSGTSVPYPSATTDLQFEGELAVAIGKKGRAIRAEDAFDHVFGYGISIDLTRRDRQFECRDMSRPWEAGKSFDHSAPCGNLVRRATAGNLSTGGLTLLVNGETKQKSDISLMIWGVADIIAHLSAQYTLEPGDIILTGTPAGVGPVVPGDIIDVVFDGLPKLSVTIAPPLT